jgi:hypothetical protein
MADHEQKEKRTVSKYLSLQQLEEKVDREGGLRGEPAGDPNP